MREWASVLKANKIMLHRREVEDMAVVYATLILKGKKRLEDVPERIREEVKAVLKDLEVQM